ncbi:MAG: class I mannose-6-phosphate isomerase [Lachnospiraceae bacterium]|nr:class I mannose-6-phosphate isomerase [Lachnospiraceae bacterium]
MNTGAELLFLKPVLKERIWGGSRLRTEWGYESARESGLGECWAVSCNEQADSVVAEGRYQGMTLSQLWAEAPELFGAHAGERFPLLVKIIDAKEDLSIQVHPDDAYAKAHGLGMGKRECWYILDCPQDAELIVGSRAESREEFERLVRAQKWDALLNRVPVRKGDFIQIEPGTLHAITAGVELLEVQQNSDITYRMYDYVRPRQLHLTEGLEVARAPYRIKAEDVVHTDGRVNTPQLLVTTADYQVWTVCVSGALAPDMACESFLIGSVIEGSGRIDGRPVEKGMHFIVPNRYAVRRLEGEMRINLAAPMPRRKVAGGMRPAPIIYYFQDKVRVSFEIPQSSAG